MPEAAGSSPALSLSLLHGEKNKFGKEFTMEKRPLDTELEVLWSCLLYTSMLEQDH